MKLLLLIITCTFSLNGFSQTEPDPIPEVEPVDDSLRIEGEAIVPSYVLEELPMFPGGSDEMKKWLEKELIFPTQDDVQGKCYVKFAVLKSGKITQVQVMRGISGCPGCDKEAVRLMKKMPLWIPGKYKGKHVATEMIIPIAFKR